ncbi:MAG: Tetracycline resistance protein, class B [Anaerolineales bacterium]|nr:Tetracycline resistance protein, class B [Anaerolineales bacterium]
MTILFLTLFIVMVGFGVIMPILPFYAENMGASATHLGLLFASYSMIQFFLAPIWGRQSDKRGRKPVILIGLVGFSVSFLLFGLATSLRMLFAARILGGILSSAVLPTVMAYVADTTDEEARGGGMGIMGAAMGMGVIFGPAIGGFLGEISPTLPFFFSAALALAVAAFALIFLPESLSEAARQEARESETQRSGLTEIWAAARGPLGFILILAFLASFAAANIEGTFALFSEAHLGFGKAEMGVVFVSMGIVMVLMQGLLVGRLLNRWGEKRMIQVGLLSSAVGYVLFLATFDMPSMIAVMAVMGVGNASLRPAVNSLVSKRTSAGEQGSMLGVVNSYNSLGRIFGPVTGGLIFDIMGYRWPYILGSVLFFLILGLSVVLFNHGRRQQVPAVSPGQWSPQGSTRSD